MTNTLRLGGSRASRNRRCFYGSAVGLLAVTGTFFWITPKILSAAPSDYRFVRVATAGKKAPGGGTFTTYFETHVVINKGNDVLFVSDTTDGKEGVYMRTMGKVFKLARTGDPAPGGGIFGPISLGRVSMGNNNDAAFGFLLANPTGPVGVGAGEYRYRASTKTLTPIVISEVTDAPGGGKFAGVNFNTGMNDNNGDSVFPGIVHGYDIDPSTPPGFNGLGVGVFRADNQYKLHVVVKPGDAAPGGRVFDWAGDATINDRRDVAFGGHLQGDECIGVPDQSVQVFCYTSVYIKQANGTVRKIAHQGDPAPGGGHYRVAYGPSINNRGEVLFLGDLTPPPDTIQDVGLFLYSQGVTRAVVRPGDTMPGGGTVKSVSPFGAGSHDANNPGDIGFGVQLNQDSDNDGSDDTGLYVLTRSEDSQPQAGPRVPGTLKLVVRSGSFIPEIGTVKHVGVPLVGVVWAGGPMNNNGTSMLVWITTTDGLSVLMLAHPKV